MNELYPVAKLGNEVLVMNKDDIPYIGRERALDVMCINVNLKYKKIHPITELEKHLKFNPWEETDEEQRNAILQSLATAFSNQEIEQKIIDPLRTSLVEQKEKTGALP